MTPEYSPTSWLKYTIHWPQNGMWERYPAGLTLSFPDDHVIHPTPPDMHLQGIFDGVHMSRCSGFVRLVGLASQQAIPCKLLCSRFWN